MLEACKLGALRSYDMGCNDPLTVRLTKFPWRVHFVFVSIGCRGAVIVLKKILVLRRYKRGTKALSNGYRLPILGVF